MTFHMCSVLPHTAVWAPALCYNSKSIIPISGALSDAGDRCSGPQGVQRGTSGGQTWGVNCACACPKSRAFQEFKGPCATWASANNSCCPSSWWVKVQGYRNSNVPTPLCVLETRYFSQNLRGAYVYVLCLYNGILLGHRKGDPATYDNMDEP